MRWPRWVLLLAACGGGEGDAADPLPEIPRPACPDHVNAEFQIIHDADGRRYVLGEYRDRPDRMVDFEPADGCTTFTTDNEQGPEPCTTTCEPEEVCRGDTCEPPINSLDVGVVHVTGTDPQLDLTADADTRYVHFSAGQPLYAPGATITVSGGGGDSSVEPFAISVGGVPELTVAATSLSAAAGEDLVVGWDPTDSPAGTRVHFYASSGDFYQDHLECWSDDTGQMTVPAGDLDHVLPASGETIDTVFLVRIDLETTETEHGCGVLETSSAVGLELGAE